MSSSENYSVFERGCESIRSLIRCADITVLHALASLRSEDTNLSTIDRILNENGVSQLAHSWRWFMTPAERDRLGERGYIRAACEQIVFLCYVTLERYLIEKCKEYIAYKGHDLDALKLAFRNLSELRRHARDYVGIHVAAFNHPSVGIYEEAEWFHPSDSWAGLQRLENYRNEIAHEGVLQSVQLVTLVDAWSVFHFVQRYGQFFEICYNDHIYNGRAMRYEQRDDPASPAKGKANGTVK